MVRRKIWHAYGAPGTGLASHPGRTHHLDLRPHRIRQDPDGILICIDRLVREALSGKPHRPHSYPLCISAQGAGNDIQKNLEGPLAEITTLAGQRGLLMPQIPRAVRTGDTLTQDRQRMLKRASSHLSDHAGVALHPADRTEEPGNSRRRQHHHRG